MLCSSLRNARAVQIGKVMQFDRNMHPTKLVSYGEGILGEDSNDRNVIGGDKSGYELLLVHKE